MHMASSNEDSEIVPECITNYWLFDHSVNPTSFTNLPLQWPGDEIHRDLQTEIFLRGTGDDGLQEVCKQVIAWRFELSYAQPEISMLSKNRKWMQLCHPKKSFEKFIRSALITVYSLHYLKRNQESSGDHLWNHLQKFFGSYELEPSMNDLVAHLSLIEEAIKRDIYLANCKYLLSIVDKDMRESIALHKDIQPAKVSKFIDDTDDVVIEAQELDAEEESSFDTVCALCDNGGTILPCEGICMRSFHATKEAGGDYCESLGFINDAQVEAIPLFRCKNCKYKKHQCFSCGRLSSSDTSSGAEVFSCCSGTCGHFYHPKCVAELLLPSDKAQAEELQKKIIAGEPFVCPVHKCLICHQSEDKTVHDLQLAVCRRCPKAYHRKCLPRDHIIDPKWGTPAREHIIFPSVEGKKKHYPPIRPRIPAKKKCATSESCSIEKTAAKMPNTIERTSDTGHVGDFLSARIRTPNITISAKISSEINQSTSSRDDNSLGKDSRFPSLSNSSFNSRPYSQKQQKVAYVDLDVDENEDRDQCSLEDTEMQNRILALIGESNASFDVDECMRKHKAKSNHAMLDRSITLGKVEHCVKAVRTALQKLDTGCPIEEAKEICEPGILKQLLVWRMKLRVYMAPFLHGVRYTSFGRHFTKSDKLKEIVERLQWYVQNGDTIVDFCCGANEFSCLLKEKLKIIGKSCSFKNYDLFPPQNTFCFEKRDWMSVETNELPDGSKLIMGLNPPFGVKASLANRFIRKALEFKPKLLTLIVPEETYRLDTGPDPYDLIWKDRQLLTGKSFYLPGSIDVCNRQLEDWNVQPPSLYLWSRHDWTSRHKALADKCGHLVNDHSLTENNTPDLPEAPAPDRPVGEQQEGGFRYIEQCPVLPDNQLIYNSCGYIQPPRLYADPHHGQQFIYPYGQQQFTSMPSTSYQSTSPYDPFMDSLPTTNPK
ncbi:hypothetical protein CDL15_Pgr023182 [Punica granatum]|uniref:Zinc finger PHD-type domain-containing protein n=1 Tax=Punica granatum TaxID=22663 RepID=A0A218X535_PUNGR|nr:hypothetical protein CDL15_Pgr023182 [Punica granatum]